jgi:hypothetical protein
LTARRWKPSKLGSIPRLSAPQPPPRTMLTARGVPQLTTVRLVS